MIPAKDPSKICRLALFTWTCAESESQKEVVPMCPKHPTVESSFGTFGTGMIVVCPEEKNHFVQLCNRPQFDAEREEARIRLYRVTLRGEEKT